VPIEAAFSQSQFLHHRTDTVALGSVLAKRARSRIDDFCVCFCLLFHWVAHIAEITFGIYACQARWTDRGVQGPVRRTQMLRLFFYQWSSCSAKKKEEDVTKCFRFRAMTATQKTQAYAAGY
jgi:hypothetical protein